MSTARRSPIRRESRPVSTVSTVPATARMRRRLPSRGLVDHSMASRSQTATASSTDSRPSTYFTPAGSLRLSAGLAPPAQIATDDVSALRKSASSVMTEWMAHWVEIVAFDHAQLGHLFLRIKPLAAGRAQRSRKAVAPLPDPQRVLGQADLGVIAPMPMPAIAVTLFSSSVGPDAR